MKLQTKIISEDSGNSGKRYYSTLPLFRMCILYASDLSLKYVRILATSFPHRKIGYTRNWLHTCICIYVISIYPYRTRRWDYYLRNISGIGSFIQRDATRWHETSITYTFGLWPRPGLSINKYSNSCGHNFRIWKLKFWNNLAGSKWNQKYSGRLVITSSSSSVITDFWLNRN